MSLDVEKLIADIDSIILRTKVLLLEQRIIELELKKEGTEIIESILGYQIE